MPPKDKGKGKKVELSLYINKTPYKYGCLCTFCNKVTAILHCPECPDFFCKDCDVTAHAVAKRKDHVRFPLSKLNLAQASRLLTRYVRLVQHLRRCQHLARIKFRRYFDKRTLNHYYFDTTYGTTSWHKPLVLRKEELFPFWELDYAASKVQNAYHIWKCRVKTVNKLVEYYRKVFDRTLGRFYYAWHGQSKLLPRSSWKAPKLCGKRGYPKDIKPIFTKDVACILVQRKWRAVCVRALLCALCRNAYDQLWDPVAGKFTYFHRETEVLYMDKPKILRGQPWDPDYVKDWSRDEVRVFLRRIGLKQYATNFYEYGIDGRTLCLLDDEDYENLMVENRVHRRKIYIEIEKRMGVIKKERVSEEHLMRREKIRKMKLFIMAATAIQTRYRVYLAKKELWLRKELIRLAEFDREVKAQVKSAGRWWATRPDIPSRDPLLFSSISLSKHYKDKEAEEHRMGLKKAVVKDNDTLALLKNPHDKVDLPAINMKRFGRYQDHENTKSGWGRYDSESGSFVSLDLSAGLNMKNFTGLGSITQLFPTRLHRKGWDYRRIKRFLGQSLEVKIKEDKHEEEGKGEGKEEEEEEEDEFAEEDAARAGQAAREAKDKAAAAQLKA